jgi:2-aminoethylphosphonate dioxygenase
MDGNHILLEDHFSEDGGKRVTSWGDQIDEWLEMKEKWMIYKEIINPVSPSQMPDATYAKGCNKGEILMKARIENFVPYHPELEEFLNHTLKPLLESKIGKKVNLFKDKMNWKHPKGHGFGAHQDHPAWTDFPPTIYWTVAIFADTATKENGCLEFGTPISGIEIQDRKILSYDREGTGSLEDEEIKKLIWEYYPTTPRDVLIFNSFAPHRSGPNNTKGSRRIFYFTFNLAEQGDHYQDYVSRKRKELPPDIEREKGKEYKILGSKYNLANPIV